MQPDVRNITIVGEDTFRFRARWLDSGEVPVPFDGYTAKAQVREIATSKKPILTLSTEDGSIVLGEEGEVDLEATPEMTRVIQGITIKEGIWALKVYPPGGEPKTLIMGRAFLKKGVVR